jgi:glycosyltransferase involved in cell wall biosynthesis
MKADLAGMDRLRIGVDGYNLAMPRSTGIATYGRVLADTLRTMGHGVEGVFGVAVEGDEALREITFFEKLARQEKPGRRKFKWSRVREHFGTAATGATALDVPFTDRVERRAFADRLPQFDRVTSSPDLFARAHRIFRRTGRFVELTMDRPPDVMHWTYPVPVTLAGARNIYTLHDLVPLKLPYTTLDGKGFYRNLVRACADKAAHLCTVSEASRADIVALLGISPDKVTNTYQASPVAPGLLSDDPAEDASAIAGVFGLPHRGYFLFFGAIEPKKNVGRLIEAYLSIQTDVPLVIVGAKAWQSDDELKLIAGGGHGPAARRILQLDYLPRALLLRLIRGARGVVFPSLYEGFGLPVLEAMQLGTPVITSNTSSLPEIGGDAVLAVDPYSVPAIAAALRRLDGDDDLRAAMAERGVARAEEFSPRRYAERLAMLYGRVMA